MATPSGVSRGSVQAVYEAQVGVAYEPTYIAYGTGYTAYATPTDLMTISGSASKIIRVYAMNLRVHTTAGALQNLFFIKRSTANTGGTATNPAGLALDSNDAAATGVVTLYTAAPTPGTGVTIYQHSLVTTVPTAAPAGFSFMDKQLSPATPASVKPVTLRGTAESLAMNFAGAALPAGFTASWEIVWSESAA